MHGRGYADDWVGRYMVDGKPMRKDQMRREFKFTTLESALDQRLERVSKPQRFGLVTTTKAQRWVTGVALGICVGTRCLFLGKGEILRMRLVDIKDAWVIK